MFTNYGALSVPYFHKFEVCTLHSKQSTRYFQTSVSEMIQKPPLVKAQTALKNKIWRKTIFNTVDGILTTCNVAQSWHWFCQVTAHYNVAFGSGIMTVNSPSDRTLQYNTWLWDDMTLNSPKCLPYWNSTSGFDFDHITAVDMSFCTSLRNFIQIGPPSAEKNDVMSIFKMADLGHLGF